MLIAFYLVMKVLGYRWWTFPLVVFGANSIFIYSFNMVLREWLDNAVGVFTFHYKGIGTLAPVAQSVTVLAVLWSLCYWMYSAEDLHQGLRSAEPPAPARSGGGCRR